MILEEKMTKNIEKNKEIVNYVYDYVAFPRNEEEIKMLLEFCNKKKNV